MWGLFLSRLSCCWPWTEFGFQYHWFQCDTRMGHIFGWAWCHYIFSLFWVSPGFSTQLVLFLILLNCSLLLASGLINYGARLGPFLHLCLLLPWYQHLNWFSTVLVTLQPLGSGLLHHLITSPWLLPIGRLIRVYKDFRLVLQLLIMLLSTQNS